MKKQISALLLSVVLCLGMLSTTALAAAPNITAEGTGKTITVSGGDGKTLCALWKGTDHKNLLLLFYPEADGTELTVEEDVAENTYYIGVEGGAKLTAVTVKPAPPAAPSPSGGDDGGGGGGGGGASAGVKVNSSTGGKVSLSPAKAAKGETVTLTAAPDEGYVLNSLTVKDSAGKALPLTKAGENRYTFTMPAGTVTVTPVFVKGAAPAAVFSDVPAGAYFYDAVQWAVQKGVTNGTGAGTFSPNAACTRAQMVTFLWRSAGCPAPRDVSNPFSDVPGDQYYTQAVLWAAERGITSGTSETTFSPNDTVTRGQTVTFLYRFAGSPAVSGSGAFSDVSGGEYYAPAVQWALNSGVTNGTSATTFGPGDNCVRAQIVTFLYRVSN